MERIKRFYLAIICIILMCPLFAHAGTELGSSTQHPIVGSNIYIQLDMLYCDYSRQNCNDPQNNIRDFHDIINYDPTALKFESVIWMQSSGSYSHDENGTIYIDKEAGTDWRQGAILQIKFSVISAKRSQVTVKRNGDSHFANNNIIGQSFGNIYIEAKKPSSSVLLSGLYIENYEITPTFNKANNNYSLSVAPEVNKVKVIAQKGDPSQTITGDGYRDLSYGENKIHVEVRAQDGTTNTYNINVVRSDNRTGDTSLKSLYIGDKSIPLEKDKYTYETTVSRSIDNILINARTTDPNAVLIGTGRKNLNIGSNKFILNVESSNGKMSDYEIIINRSTEEFETVEDSNKLRNISVNGTKLDLSDNKTRWFYGINSEYDTLSINAVTESETAKITITGNEDLKPGLNKIEIKVTETRNITEERPETPADSTIYTLIVYKKPDNVITIDSLEELPDNSDLFYKTTNEDGNTISKETQELLKENNQKLYYNLVNSYDGLLFQIILDGSINEDLNIYFKENDSGIYETELPKDIEILLNVGEKFNDSTNVKIYTIDENNKYVLLTDGLTVQNGYIKFTTNGDSQYIITTVPLIKEEGPIEKWFKQNKTIIFGILGFLVISLLAVIIINKNKKKNSNEPQY